MAVDYLRESAERLQGNGYGVACWPDGRAKAVDINKAWPKGAAVYSGQEMRDYAEAPPEVRAIMREVKKLR